MPGIARIIGLSLKADRRFRCSLRREFYIIGQYQEILPESISKLKIYLIFLQIITAFFESIYPKKCDFCVYSFFIIQTASAYVPSAYFILSGNIPYSSNPSLLYNLIALPLSRITSSSACS